MATNTELLCTECGHKTSHADAQIADLNKTCEREQIYWLTGEQRSVTVDSEHNWIEV